MLMFYLDDTKGVLFHIEDGDKVLGYCRGVTTYEKGLCGSSTSMAQYSFNKMIKALILKPWLIFHSENLKRIPLIKKIF
jgi:hypothetical protein